MITLENLKPQLEALSQAVESLAETRASSAPDSNLRITFHRADGTPEQIRDLVLSIFPTLQAAITYYEVDGDSWHTISAREPRSHQFSVDIYTAHTATATPDSQEAA